MTGAEQYYDRMAAREWSRLDVHRTEFAVTMRALGEYLPPPTARILDIGSGPGRYAITLTKRGYKVTVVDISASSLSLAREKAKAEDVEIDGYVLANAINLANVPDNVYDAALLMGPLYHLLKVDERQQAIREAKRTLKPGGVLFAAFITRFAPFRDAAKEYPDWLIANPDYAQELLRTGIHNRASSWAQAYFAHPNEITPLMEGMGFQTVNLIGCEGIVAGLEEKINDLTDEDWQVWVNFNYQLGKDPAMHGAADHLLYIGRK